MLLNVYNRFNVHFVRGQGCYLYDDKGNEYLDFVSGIAVNCLGHASPVMVNALKAQSEKLIHISNLYHSAAQTQLSEKLVALSQHERVFFCNSGTEANELALKIARKHGRNLDPQKTEIIYMHNSFHGRSTGALAITGQKKYQQDFEPLMPNMIECTFNDLTDFKSKISDQTCAVFIEPIQGESGLKQANIIFLETLKKECERVNALLIFDEIQCGMGRTGTLFAYEQWGIIPDVVTIAKALGGGIPIGACLTRGKANEALVPGDHGSTYGGNPLMCAVAHAVLTELTDNGVVNDVAEKGRYATEQLNTLKKNSPMIEEIRGKGLLIGIKFNDSINAADIVKKAFEKRFLLVGAGDNVVRFFPPLNVTLSEIDQAVKKLEAVLAD